MNGGRQDMYAIPGSRALVSQYLLLLKDAELHRYVSPDYAVAHLVVRHQLSTHRALLKAAADIRQYVNAHFSKDLTVSVASRELAEAEAAALLLKEHALYPVMVLLLAFAAAVAGLSVCKSGVCRAAAFDALHAVLFRDNRMAACPIQPRLKHSAPAGVRPLAKPHHLVSGALPRTSYDHE